MGKSARKWLAVALAGLGASAVSAGPTMDTRIGGLLQIDQSQFMAKTEVKQDMFTNGANINLAKLSVTSDLGDKLTANFELSFEKDSKVNFYEAHVVYQPNDNWTFTVGHDYGMPFGGDYGLLSEDVLFLDYGLTSKLGPDSTISAVAGYHAENWSLNIGVGEPSGNESNVFGNDKTTYVSRFNIVPVQTAKQTYHFGASYFFSNLHWTQNGELSANNISISAPVGVMSRRTGALTSVTTHGRNKSAWGLDASMAYCSWWAGAEYTSMRISRGDVGETTWGTQVGNARFHAWQVATGYFLTGEQMVYNLSEGTWSLPEPMSSKYGALQLAARFEYITFNSKELNGGGQHNLSLGVNWLYTKNVYVKAAYTKVRAKKYIDEETTSTKSMDTFGLRLVVKF